jgi:muramoyltetrapeptide carboxypeptidase
MRVRVEAPSSPFPHERLAAGAAVLERAGFQVDTSHAEPRSTHAYLAGDDATRARSLSEALASDVDLVWLARGGYGLTRILDDLVVPARGPRIIGFSDATALLFHLRAHGSHGHVHGPLITTVAQESSASFAHLLDVIARRETRIDGIRSLDGKAHDVSGPILAANLCVLGHLIGTRALPPGALAGSILCLEEIGERPYRIDRMLTHLIAARVLDGVRAVIVGDLLDCDEKPNGALKRDPAPAPLAVFVERLAGRVPLLAGVPIGHGTPNFAIPFGADARVRAGDTGTIEIGARGSA